jgi:hypothetical protein
MRKSAVMMPLAFLLAGVLGLFVRRWELDTVFDSATGLTARYAPVTLLLIGLSAAALVLSAVLGIVVASRHKAEPEYGRAFKPGSFRYVGASFIFGLGLLAAVVLQYFRRSATGIVTIIDWIFLLLAALTAVSVILLAMGAYTRRRGGRMILFSIIPPLFFCFWLIVLYKDNAKNPVLLDYCYQSLAIAASALSFYFGAGYVFKKPAVGWTVFSNLITVFFCVLVLADNVGLPLRLIFGIVALVAWINANAFIRNLKPKDEK